MQKDGRHALNQSSKTKLMASSSSKALLSALNESTVSHGGLFAHLEKTDEQPESLLGDKVTSLAKKSQPTHKSRVTVDNRLASAFAQLDTPS